jgi:hypothetical protein
VRLVKLLCYSETSSPHLHLKVRKAELTFKLRHAGLDLQSSIIVALFVVWSQEGF